MVFWTKAATIIGFALLVIAFFQFRSQNDQTREALRLAAEANDTAKQAREDATKATADTLKVAERQLYMTLRARMGLTQIEAVDFKANTQALIRFYFRNFGGKGGFIEDYCVYSPPVGDPLPPTPDYPASEWRESGVPVEAGDVYELMVDINAVPDVAWNMITDETRNVRLVFIGQIRYRVGFGKDVLRIGFCREYDPKLSRLAKQPIFKNVGGKAYNYAD
ncbi:MAG: hypothetical protein Q7R30_19090 [Acidobacteriota bacterium]|nr:hypothetical protein [Acidobacteriota bacterium]